MLRKKRLGTLRNSGRETFKWICSWMVKFHCHLDKIENNLGDKSLGMPVRDCLDKSTEVWRPVHCGQHHPPGMGSLTHYKGKVSPAQALVILCFFTNARWLTASSSHLCDFSSWWTYMYFKLWKKQRTFKNLSFLKFLFQDIKADAMSGKAQSKKGQWEGP